MIKCISVIGPFEDPGLQAMFETFVEQVAVLRSVGRLFQALGAATENALSPSRWLVRGTT